MNGEDAQELQTYRDDAQGVADDKGELETFRAEAIQIADDKILSDAGDRQTKDEGWVEKKVKFLPLEKGSILRHRGVWFAFDEETNNWVAVGPDDN